MAKKVTANGKTFTFDDNITNDQIGTVIDEYFSSAEKKNRIQPVAPTTSKPLPTGSKPSQTQEDTNSAIRESVNKFRGGGTKGYFLNGVDGGNDQTVGTSVTPSVLLSDEQKQQREQERIGKRFETTLLNVPTEFGKVGQFMRSAKKVKDTLPQIPTIKPDTGGMVVIPDGSKIGDSLRKGDTLQDEFTDKFTGKKTALQKQIENAENAFRAYQGDEIANQVQSYIPPEETLKIKQELGFGEKMSNAGSNFVNKLERFVPNTALAVGQTLTTLLGEDLGSDAYRMVTAGGNADVHRMEAFDKLAKLDTEYKYSKGLIQSIQDFDLGGVAAAVTDAVGSLVSSVVTSAPTAGLGLYADMVGSGLYDYNSTKANRLGITVEQLYDSGQNDFFVPAILSGVGAQLEKIGLKGIKQGILSNIKSKAGQKAGLIFHNSNKEGFTEWTQSGLEAYSNSLAQGKNAIQAGEEAVKEMFSKKGAESYLMGSVAAGAAIGGGRILKGIVSSREKKKAADALQKIEQQQQELNNPAISEESRVFIFDNIKNNIKEVVDAVYADVDESDSLSESQKKEVFELNKTIQALEIVANDPAVSEETKASAQTRIDELKLKVDGIIATPKIKLAKPTFDTEEQLIEEIRAAEKEFNETGDAAEYQLKINDLNQRLENLVPAPEGAETGKTEEVVSKDEVKESIRSQAKEEIANVLDDESLTEQQKEERVQQIVSAAKAQMKIKESDLKLPSLVVGLPTLSLSTPPDPFKVRLQELGYSDADISNMTIEQQQDIIENKRQATEVASSAKVDSVKENARQERIAQMQSELDEDAEGEGLIQDVENYFTDNTRSTQDSKYNPDLSGEGELALQEQEETLLQLGADRIQAHGLAKGSIGQQFKDLLNILTNGLDNRGGGQLYTAPLVMSADMRAGAGAALGTGGGTAYTDGGFIILAREGVNEIRNVNDIGGVLVNQAVADTLPELIDRLKQAFPNISIESYSNAPKAIESIQSSEQTKTKSDAVQVETAGQVPVQPEAETGEEVEQGKPQPKVEGVTKEGVQEEVGTGSGVNKGIDFSAAFKNAGKQIADVLYSQVFDALEKGETKISGVSDPLIKQMKPLYDKGEIKSAQDIAKIVRNQSIIQEQTPAQQVEQLRAKEQAELKAAIPNADQYLTDGKVDRAKITDAKDLKKFDEIYDKYDKLITPLLPKKETKAAIVGVGEQLKPKKDHVYRAIDNADDAVGDDKSFSNKTNWYGGEGFLIEAKKSNGKDIGHHKGAKRGNIKAEDVTTIYYDPEGIATDVKTFEREFEKMKDKFPDAKFVEVEYVEDENGEFELRIKPAPAKTKPKLKSKVATRLLFKKAVDLFYDISGTEGSAKKRTISAKRRTFMEQNPSIKYIDDNWSNISKQLEEKGLLKKEGNCP